MRRGDDSGGFSGALRASVLPISARPHKSVARNCVPVVLRHGLPLYPSFARGDLLRGTGQSVPMAQFAIEHLPRSRAISQTFGAFSCKFLSWPVRGGPTASLYANPARAVARNTRCVPPRHTPSSGSLSATPVPGAAGSARVIARPSDSPLCSRGAICPATVCQRRLEHASAHRSSRAGLADFTSRNPVSIPPVVPDMTTLPLCVREIMATHAFNHGDRLRYLRLHESWCTCVTQLVQNG